MVSPGAFISVLRRLLGNARRLGDGRSNSGLSRSWSTRAGHARSFLLQYAARAACSACSACCKAVSDLTMISRYSRAYEYTRQHLPHHLKTFETRAANLSCPTRPQEKPSVRLSRSSRRLRNSGTAHRGPIFRFCVPGPLAQLRAVHVPIPREAAARHRTARIRSNQHSVTPRGPRDSFLFSISAPRNQAHP
jgi:hypothetical protein